MTRARCALLDPRIGRGTCSTFHARYPFLRWPLDHVFCTNDFTLVLLDRLGDIVSDHFSILAVLQHSLCAQSAQPKPDADTADQEMVRDKIDKVAADEDAPRQTTSPLSEA